MTTPKHTIDIPTPAHLDATTAEVTFRLATYDWQPDGSHRGGTWLECHADDWWHMDWEVFEGPTEARKILQGLSLDDLGLLSEECED